MGNSPCCAGCAGFLGHSNLGLVEAKRERETYERIIQFLATVPLFKKQIPQSDLPKLANSLLKSKKTWRSGEVLVRQGDMGKAFFLIMSGEVEVITQDDGAEETVRATLGVGDHFGGHTLVSERPNVATIRARDSTTGGYRSSTVETLSLERKDFNDLGLKDLLKWTKRPAIHRERATEDLEDEGDDLLSTQDRQFIMDAIRRNVNLGSVAQNSSLLESVSHHAKKRAIPKDTTVAKIGEVGKEFFIIKSGSFDVVMNTAEETKGQRGAEQVVVKSTVAERLARKQEFLRGLHQTQVANKTSGGKFHSVVGAAHDRTGGAPLRRGPTKTEPESPGAAKKKATKRNRMSMPPIEDNTLRAKNAAAVETLENIKVGQRVTCAIPGEHEEAVGVVKAMKAGTAKVDFGGKERDVDILLLRIAQDPDVIATLREKDSFGELSLMYHTRREATFVAKEDSMVYVITAKRFRELMARRSGETYKKNCALFDEVSLLAPLVCAERYELATHANRVSFPPGEVILRQGLKRMACLWYVVESGQGIVNHHKAGDKEPTILGEIHRGGHFGEQSLLTEEKIPSVNVAAGPSGMTCLCIDGELAVKTLKYLCEDNAGASSPEEWMSGKPTERQGGGSSRCEIKLKDLNEVCVLGSGAFATVFLMQEQQDTSKRYAMKRMSKGHLKRNNMIESVCWEKDLMSMIHTNFVINLLKTFNDDQHIYFLMDVGLGGTLYKVLTDHPDVFAGNTSMGQKGFPAAFYVGCITLGLEHLHERNIAYRDLKPENVLLDERGYAKICDMGFARFVLGKTNTLAGTPDYMAPEMIDFPHTHNQTVDWWALGVLTFELANGQCPYEDEGISPEEDPHGRLLAIRRSQERNNPRYPFSMPMAMKSFIMKLLEKDKKRLGKDGADEVKSDKWFQGVGINFEQLKSMLINAPYLPAPFRVPRHGSDDYEEEPEDQACHYEPDPSNRWSRRFDE